MIFLTGAEKDSKNLETIAVRRTDGKIIWRRSVEAAEIESHHKVNNPAAATCATDGHIIVSYFGSFGVVGYDWNGRELWRYPMPRYESLNGNGSSPLLVNGNVYLNREDQVEQVLIALDAANGKEIWKHKHANAQADMAGVASTPILWNRQILIHRGGSLSAHSLPSGESAWFIPAHTTGCSTPVISDGKLIVSTWNHAGEADQAPPWPEFTTLLRKHDTDKNGKLSETEIPDDLPILIRPYSS